MDGYLAGSVDDFDGVFQRLNVAPGEHELTIYLDGFQTITQKVYFQPVAPISAIPAPRTTSEPENTRGRSPPPGRREPATAPHRAMCAPTADVPNGTAAPADPAAL